MFKIIKVIMREPIVYRLVDLNDEEIEGVFYESELQKVEIKPDTVFKIDKILSKQSRGPSKKVLVKWKGYPNKFNSWILASDLQPI